METILPPDYDAKRDGSTLFHFGDDPCFPCHDGDNVRVSPQVRATIAQAWRDSAMSAETAERETAELLALPLDSDGLISLRPYSTEIDYASADSFGIEAGLTLTPELAQFISERIGDGLEMVSPRSQGYEQARRLMELLDDGVGTLIRVAKPVPPLIARLQMAGFERVQTPRGPAMRIDNECGCAQFTNRKGTELPSEGDWALEVWRDGHEDEADTDIQSDDEGADMGEAIAVALGRLHQMKTESANA